MGNKNLFGNDLTSRGYKKDIATETPDFIGGFTVLSGDFSRVKIVDVKRPISLCGMLRTQTKPNIRTRLADSRQRNKNSVCFFIATEPIVERRLVFLLYTKGVICRAK